MNLYFRVIRVLFAALFGRRLDGMADSVVRFRVWPHDLDLNLHMNNGRYLALMDLGRLDLMLRLGLGPAIVGGRWMPVLASAVIRFRRSLAPFQRFALRTRVLGWDEKWIFMEHVFEVDGHIAARALVKGAFRVNRGTVPAAEVVTAAGWSPVSPEMPRYVAEWLAAEEHMSERAMAKAAA
ncbi:MAG: thioesterase family protein [Inquilinus sp.]|nr:thioesterase family protein [Inquilinus sp.]